MQAAQPIKASAPFSVIEEDVPGPPEELPPVAPAPTAPGLNDPEEFAEFINSLFQEELSQRQAPGAVIAVVKDGEVFFTQGYGYANLAENIPVEADKTLFRVASLSKLFTATATMQLYEQGKLDVNEDVSPYLGDRVQLQNPFPEPVTFAQIMMHTDGSTKRRVSLAARTEAGMEPLEDYLADHMPPIEWPPGELYSYSSHTIALLGYLVQQISGRPFEDYIDENILQPLNMQRSTFLQPPPPELADNLAVGYQQQSGEFKPVPYLYLNIGPAAALQATATDMANFMIAHLINDGDNPFQILQPATLRLMHETHYRPHPLLPGTGYSFRERWVNNIRTIGHLGSLRGYSSSLTLMPDQNIGIFIASNSFSGIHGRILKQFFDRYFPAAEATRDVTPLNSAAIDLDRFTGTYRDLEYPHHTIAKISAPYRRIHIRRRDRGLQIETPGLFFRSTKDSILLEPLEPLLFRRMNENTDSDALMAFEENEQGRITYAYNPLFPKIGTYVKVAWYETIWVHAAVLGLAVILFLTAAFIWPLHPLWRRLKGKSFEVEVARSHPGPWLIAGAIATLNLIFLISFPLSLWLYGAWKLVYGMPWFAVALLGLPLLATALTVLQFVYTIKVWRNHDWARDERLHYSAVTLGAIAFVALLAYWNILGFQF